MTGDKTISKALVQRYSDAQRKVPTCVVVDGAAASTARCESLEGADNVGGRKLGGVPV